MCFIFLTGMSVRVICRGIFLLVVLSILSLLCNFNSVEYLNTVNSDDGFLRPIRVPYVSELCRNPDLDKELQGYYGNITIYSHPGLPRLLDAEQRKINTEFLMSIKKLFCDVNATWTLYFGSLLGAYISHDLLAWDDDLDIILDDDDITPVIEMHKNGTLASKYNIGYANVTGLHKLYWTRSEIISPWWWSWPFVDVITFKRTNSEIQLLDREKLHIAPLDKKSVFPLHLRPFGGAWLPVPRDPWTLMKVTYHKEIRKFKCEEPGYDHVREIVREKKRMVDCNSLRGYYPFAYREQNGTTESLKLGDRVIYTWQNDNEPVHTGAQPFDWRWS